MNQVEIRAEALPTSHLRQIVLGFASRQRIALYIRSTIETTVLGTKLSSAPVEEPYYDGSPQSRLLHKPYPSQAGRTGLLIEQLRQRVIATI